ncbi:MAG: lytic murein transglycosylase B [Legionellales bacterium]|nr:lytic murein transglycosylase B [Legionellales bacterium]
MMERLLNLKKHLLTWICSIGFILFLVSISLSVQAANNTKFVNRPDVQKFINMMVKNYGFKKSALEHVFSQVKEQPSIVLGMSTTKEHLPWYKYNDIFITQQRIDEGVAFWKKHQKTLQAVYQRDGVDPSVIVAILGVETYYGKNQGSYRVIDSLSTLAFDYPARAKFFQQELKEYLLLTRENHINPLKLKGSYAGAMGQPQFMPSSYRQYAVNFNKQGQKDLAHDPDDVIASVSNYFKQNGWTQGELIAIQANVKGEAYKVLPTNQLKPNTTIKKLLSYGVSPISPLPATEMASFIVLEMPDNSQQYWLGLHNFYVISRYNPRINYAMAVFQLSSAISRQYTSGK